MNEKTDETRLDALNANIAKSREDIAALSASLKRLSEWTIDTFSVDGDKRNGKWTTFRHGLGEAGARGAEAAKGVADEIERHPLIGSMVAFGLGLWIATLLFRRNNGDSGQ